ncbi:hypothetical protein ACPXB3_21490 [Gordonia sp. DT219]|uniref:hypothetical protein n=1 Tax=Gordonia sp. DT219 TaxID=3416658 RepID=UPI003CED74DE
MTVWADVSEWQRPVDDSYPYRMIAIRANDGTYRDRNWDSNYGWCRSAADSGRLDCFIVYLVYRPNWKQTLDTIKSMVGSPHPKMIVMVDVESWGGQIAGDQSAGIDALVSGLRAWCGRVIAYMNPNDSFLWPGRPADVPMIVPRYASSRPSMTGMIGWQYTDGSGYGPSGWPQGAAPFGACDMNYTDLSTTDFAAQCGIGEDIDMAAKDDIIGFIRDYVGPIGSDVKDIRQQLTGGRDAGEYPGWRQLGQNDKGQNLTVVDSLADARNRIIALEKVVAELKAAK